MTYSSLSEKRLPKRIMTEYEKVISARQPVKESPVRNIRKLTFFSPVATRTGKDEIPNGV